MTPVTPSLLGLSLLVAGLPAHGGGASDLDSLVAAERAFARDAVEHGMRTAFLTHLAADAVIFRPFPVNGREWFAARPEAAGALLWRPAFAEVAASGNLGWTTGPWEFRPAGTTGEASAFGHFVSVWRREADGVWRVAIDAGPTHARPPAAADTVGAPERRPAPAPGAADPDSLLAAEREYAGAAGRGVAAALALHADPALRLYREGLLPVIGLDAARAAVAGERPPRWQARDAEISASGDLGYTYGIGERAGVDGAAADSSAFLRVWRRADERWRIALELDLPAATTPPRKE